MDRAAWTEDICLICSNGKAEKQVDKIKISQTEAQPTPHPTEISTCTRGSDKGCTDLYGENFCCMAIQALEVSNDIDE